MLWREQATYFLVTFLFEFNMYLKNIIEEWVQVWPQVLSP